MDGLTPASRSPLMSSPATVTLTEICSGVPPKTLLVVVAPRAMMVYSPGATFEIVKLPSGRNCPPEIVEIPRPPAWAMMIVPLVIGLPAESTAVPAIRASRVGVRTMSTPAFVCASSMVTRWASPMFGVPG
jgi:hypothetical protein